LARCTSSRYLDFQNTYPRHELNLRYITCLNRPTLYPFADMAVHADAHDIRLTLKLGR
jgi:hypothetical protein